MSDTRTKHWNNAFNILGTEKKNIKLTIVLGEMDLCLKTDLSSHLKKIYWKIQSELSCRTAIGSE